MKHLRIILIGALAALALMAATAGSASAATLCNTNTSPCGSPFTGMLNFELARTAPTTTEDAVLKGTFFGISNTVTCRTGTEDSYVVGGEGSYGTGNTTANGSPIIGTIDTFAFQNCSNGLGNCTVTIAALPWNVQADTVGAIAGADGWMDVTLGVNGASVQCSFGTCVFGSSSTVPNKVRGNIYNAGNANRKDTTGADAGASQVHFPGVTLTSQTANCTNGTWTGNYAVKQGTTLGSGANVFIKAS
jgi:hypothetical protein